MGEEVIPTAGFYECNDDRVLEGNGFSEISTAEEYWKVINNCLPVGKSMIIRPFCERNEKTWILVLELFVAAGDEDQHRTLKYLDECGVWFWSYTKEAFDTYFKKVDYVKD